MGLFDQMIKTKELDEISVERLDSIRDSNKEEILLQNQDSLYDKMQKNTVIEEDMDKGLRKAENFIKKFYLDDLKHFDVSAGARDIQEFQIGNNACLFHIDSITFNKEENTLDKLNNVYSSLHNLGLSVIFLIKCDGVKIDMYLGTKSSTVDFESEKGMGKIFEKAFAGNFPGSTIRSIDEQECSDLLKGILPKDGNNAVTSLTSLPALKDDESENSQYIQGIEKFIDTMKNEHYTVLIISDPVSGGQIEEVKHGYEELYTELAPLLGYEMSIGKNDAKSITKSEMDGYTDTIGRSVSKTQSFSRGTSITKSESTTNTFGIGLGMFGSNGVSSSSSDTKQKNIISSTIMGIFGGVVQSAMSAATSAVGINAGVNASRAKTKGTAEGEHLDEQEGSQEGRHNDHSVNHQDGLQYGLTEGSTSSVNVKYENRSIKGLMAIIDEHLKRLEICENYGMWASSAYFISPSKETSIIAASAYKGIINGEGTSLEAPSINTWYKDENVKKMNAYLRCFSHPRFHDKDYLVNTEVIADITAATMVSTKELSIQCNIPYKSVAGIAVREMAEFGRNIYGTDSKEIKKIRLGDICHMGTVDKNVPVEIDIERLKEHVFITGSTGSGKSNTVYEIVSRLNNLEVSHHEKTKYLDKKIPTLIIEPAKGEYKNIFGDEFNVFGTNADYTEVLKINPFQFEDGVHVLEHIDRLIDIFNVCWPMYAAMPAVLKEAVEQAYVLAGWDLRTSKTNDENKIYPCFEDLLYCLKNVIGESDFSQEVKDNYSGALVTRVKSLTNGFFRDIFCGLESEDNNIRLYEESTIVDLSRIGSPDTKALIMGILILRLQERRMSQGGINNALKHITILEEAHHLLKRTSTEQSSESSNLLGKSVEMISNAIAEMRTYGEGFVIVDQAPGLLDLSVIRNTNTKIIMRLPDFSDRELVGKAAGLDDNQIMELARIPSGVAAIYQNKWIEPVLCAIDEYKVKPKLYDYQREDNAEDEQRIKYSIVEYLLSNISGDEVDIDVEKITKRLIRMPMSVILKKELIKALKKEKPLCLDEVFPLVTKCVENVDKAFANSIDAKNIIEWNEYLKKELRLDEMNLSKECIENILDCVIHQKSLTQPEGKKKYRWWMEQLGRRG